MQWHASLVMLCEAIQRWAVVAPVFRELGWQLHCVPLHTVDSCCISVFNFRQHVLQTVTKLVEQCLDLTEGHQRRNITDRRRPVACQVRHGFSAHNFAALDAHVHPGATTLVFWRSEEHTSELQSLMRISY